LSSSFEVSKRAASALQQRRDNAEKEKTTSLQKVEDFDTADFASAEQISYWRSHKGEV